MAMLITKTAGCGVLGDWGKNQGLWHPYSDAIRPGDVLLLDFSEKHKTRQHAAIAVSQTGNTITTIEGNTSVTSDDNGGAVMRRTRYISQVVGFIRPKWTSTQTAAKLLRIAQAELGVTEYPSGSNKVKYNTWFYGRAVSGDAYPWCAVFVCWCFAVLAGQIDTGKTYESTQMEDITIMVSAKQLQKGSKGSAVKKLQILLNGLGFSCGTVDSDFGAKTQAAVKLFQKACGLAQDGVVGAKTWEKLIG